MCGDLPALSGYRPRLREPPSRVMGALRLRRGWDSMPRHSIHNRLALRERGAGMKLDATRHE